MKLMKKLKNKSLLKKVQLWILKI